MRFLAGSFEYRQSAGITAHHSHENGNPKRLKELIPHYDTCRTGHNTRPTSHELGILEVKDKVLINSHL